MLTVTFNEMELNAVLAGLVQVIHSNSVAKGNLQQQRDSPSNREAIECCDMAIRHAMAAQLTQRLVVWDGFPEVEGCEHRLADGVDT